MRILASVSQKHAINGSGVWYYLLFDFKNVADNISMGKSDHQF